MASGALAQIVRRAATPGQLADVIAAAMIEDPFERQGILETLSVARRLLRVERAASASLALTAANVSSLRN
jgi:hypothetical protein